MDVIAITYNEEEAQTAVESTMDITFKGGNRMTIEQVATQQWEGNQIVRELFYNTQQR